MGKDLERILIQNIHLNTLKLTPPIYWNHRRYFENSKSLEVAEEQVYAKRSKKYHWGTMVIDSGCIHVEYMMLSKEIGDLLLTVSLPELYFGNNSHHLDFSDLDDFITRVLKELRFVLHVKDLPDWKKWGLARDEQNLDIIDLSINNAIRFEVCSKHRRLPRKAADRSYADYGTLYFHSGASREKAGRQLIVYKKTLQQFKKGNDLRKILQLPTDYDVLRIEEKTKGSPLETNVTSTRKSFELPEEFTKMEIALSKEYQLYHTRRMLSDLGFDKKITTKKTLYTIVDKLPTLSRKTKKTCKLVIRYLNGEFKSVSLCDTTIQLYKKTILATGFHYLYAEADIPAVGIDEETGRCVILNP